MIFILSNSPSDSSVALFKRLILSKIFIVLWGKGRTRMLTSPARTFLLPVFRRLLFYQYGLVLVFVEFGFAKNFHSGRPFESTLDPILYFFQWYENCVAKPRVLVSLRFRVND